MPIDRWNSDPRIGEVLALRRGLTFTSRWPDITDAVRAYGQLNSENSEGRQRALLRIQNASRDWKRNQDASKVVLVKPLVNRKHDALNGLDSCVAQEWVELAKGSVPKQPLAKGSVPTEPMEIGPSGSGGFQRSAFAASTSPPEVEGVDKYGVWPQKKSEMRSIGINDEDIDALHTYMDIHVHLTNDEYARPIAEQGIHPGRGLGIGLPTDDGRRRPDSDNFYTLSGSSSETTALVQGEAGLRNVVVFSRKGSLNAYRDANYPKGGARAVPKDRHSIPLDSNTPLADQPGSLVLPLDEESAQHLSSFMGRITNATTPPPDVHAAALLERYLQKKISQMRFY